MLKMEFHKILISGCILRETQFDLTKGRSIRQICIPWLAYLYDGGLGKVDHTVIYCHGTLCAFQKLQCMYCSFGNSYTSRVLQSSLLDYRWIAILVHVLNNYWMRFCDIWNKQGRGQCYQPKPKAEANNTNWDLDYFGYHKNWIS